MPVEPCGHTDIRAFLRDAVRPLVTACADASYCLRCLLPIRPSCCQAFRRASLDGVSRPTRVQEPCLALDVSRDARILV